MADEMHFRHVSRGYRAARNGQRCRIVQGYQASTNRLVQIEFLDGSTAIVPRQGVRRGEIMTAEIIGVDMSEMVVCVPGEFTDDQVKEFAESAYPSETNGWSIRRGLSERVPCKNREGHVHIVLDA